MEENAVFSFIYIERCLAFLCKYHIKLNTFGFGLTKQDIKDLTLDIEKLGWAFERFRSPQLNMTINFSFVVFDNCY